MSISYEDRLSIGRYIYNQSNLSFLEKGKYAPCMSFVKNLIEKSTEKKILRDDNIFQNNIANIPNKIQIFDINDFNNHAFNGEIICITYPNGVIRHYALYYHIRHNGVDYNIIGVNGFMYNYQPISIFKEIILSKIRSIDFSVVKGEFFYTNQLRNDALLTATISQNYIYKIPYNLR